MHLIHHLERLSGRNLRHLTPRYVVDRIAVAFDQRLRPSDPWLTRDAIRLRECWLRPSDRGLEWGSGRSTLWFALRVGALTSVEHDASWAATVRSMLASEPRASPTDYRLEPDGATNNADSRYVGVARSLADRSLDFALVDGVARDHCAWAVLPKLRPGGLLVIDNANWFLDGPYESRSPNSRNGRGPSSEVWAAVAAEVARWRCI